MSGNHSNNVGDIVTPQTNDVLSGRGRGVMLNAGNRLLHDVVDRNRERYQNAKKMAKKEIVIEAIEEVRSHGSRFLQKDKNGQHSIASESWVRDKVGHLFRERKRTKPSKLGSYDGAVETSQQQGDSPENILNGTVPNGSTNNSNSKSKPGFGFEFLKRKSLTLRSSFKLRRDSLRRDSFKMNPSPSHNDDVGDQEEDSKSFKTTLLQKQKLIFSMLSTKDKTNAAVEEEERSKNTNSTDLSSTPDYHPQYSQGETTLVTQQDPMAYNSNNATKEPSYSEDDATYNASVPPSLNPQPPYNPTSGTPPPIPTPMGATGLLSNSNLVHRVSDKLGAGSSSTSLPTTTTTTTTVRNSIRSRYFHCYQQGQSLFVSLYLQQYQKNTASFKSTSFSPSSIAMSTTSTTSTDNTIIDVASNLEEVRANIEKICQETAESTTNSNSNNNNNKVQLVAVSKTKPIELLMQAYEAGQRVFGENYVQELCGKVPDMPEDITWHYIGPLQSNKANILVKTVYPRLVVETVASTKLANKLQNAVQLVVDETKDDEKSTSCPKLDIYVQVNTSGEESKSGVTPGEETIQLCQHIMEKCGNLNLKGLMTIGAPNDTSCFDVLAKCRDDVTTALELSSSSLLELSMGMSGDYPQAIQHGATSVRVGSTIFGARDYSNLKKN
mmetsp:Transcript_11253/g.15836  ORF Transcript_11253/g.15836 Transcript_11253/m.15836 type:complete len:666 (-) Transcript_11253:484-2481(-)